MRPLSSAREWGRPWGLLGSVHLILCFVWGPFGLGCAGVTVGSTVLVAQGGITLAAVASTFGIVCDLFA